MVHNFLLNIIIGLCSYRLYRMAELLGKHVLTSQQVKPFEDLLLALILSKREKYKTSYLLTLKVYYHLCDITDKSQEHEYLMAFSRYIGSWTEWKIPHKGKIFFDDRVLGETWDEFYHRHFINVNLGEIPYKIKSTLQLHVHPLWVEPRKTISEYIYQFMIGCIIGYFLIIIF